MSSGIFAYCEECDTKVELKNVITYKRSGEFLYYKGTCPHCGARIKSDRFIPEGHTIYDPLPPKRKFRDRPQVIPHDLEDKLKQEQEYRRQREQQDGNKVDGGSTEDDAAQEL